MTKEDRRKELKDINQKRIQLGQLAGQLGGFVGQSESVKKAVENAIIAYFDTNPHLKCDLKDVYSSHVTNLSESDNPAVKAVGTGEIGQLKQKVADQIAEITSKIESLNEQIKLSNNSLPSPSPSAELGKLQSKLDALTKVKKLCEFLSNSNNQQNEPKRLLDNLCDGLETFLGFDSATKGYTGQGIVYSDLDRLCDGVMAFLSGVLKDVSEKQPYNVGKNELISIVEMLQNKLSTGRKGFSVIAQVARKVGEYNERVTQSNDHVKTAIDWMQDKMKTLKEEVSAVDENNSDAGDLLSTAETSASTLVRKCLRDAAAALKAIQDSRENINNFNANLRDNVRNSFKSVRHERRRLDALSKKEHEDLVSMMKRINEVLNGMRKHMNEQIRTHIKQLVEQLKGLIQAIVKQLVDIRNMLQSYIAELETWMEDTKQFIEKSKIDVSALLNEVNEDSAFSHVKPIKNAAEELRQKAQELCRAGEAALASVQEHVDLALADVKMMDGKIKFNLSTVKNEISRLISDYVKNSLLNKIKTDVNSIKGNSGLQGFADHIKKTYAATYKRFNDVVQEWIVEIMGDGLVKEAIAEYVNHSSKSQFDSQYINTKTDAIMESQKNQIAGVIKKAIGINIVDADIKSNTVEGNIGAVDDCITAFVRQLREAIDKGKHSSGDTNTFVSSIAKAVEEFVTSGKGSTNITFLNPAISIIITALHAKASQAQDELYSFTGIDVVDGNIGKNVDTAWNVAEQLGIDLEKATVRSNTGADLTPESPYNVDKHIGDKFEARLKEGGNGKVIIDKTYFVDYDNHIKQDSATLHSAGSLKGQKDEGSLPLAIGDIQRGVEQALAGLQKLNQNAETQFNNIVENFENLCIAISNAAAFVTADFNHLKNDKIDNQHTAIRKHLRNLQNVEFVKVMYEADEYINTKSDKLCAYTIDALESLVDYEVRDAIDKLTTAARRNYVSSVKQLLTAFADKVSQELRDLPEEIDEDLTIGFKGLMRKVQGEFEGTSTTNANIEKLSELVSKISGKNVNHKEAFQKLSDNFQHFFRPLHKYLLKEIKDVNDDENKKKNPQGTDPEKHYTHKLLAIYEAVNKLLEHLGEKNRYDHKVHDLLDKLNDSVSSLTPENFARRSTPVIDAITDGLQHLVRELRKVYISRYDSEVCGELIKDYKQISSLTGVVEQYEVTAEGRNCAKVCLTTFTILFNSLTEVRKVCDGEGKFKKIYLSTEQTKNRVGDYLALCGYTVSNRDEQNGELQYSDAMRGKDIWNNLCKYSTSLFKSMSEDDFSGRLKDIFDYLHYYYQVCHLSTTTSKKHPSSIYDMLQWLCGLTYNGVHQELTVNGFSELFDKREDNADDVMGDDLSGTYLNARSLEAHPHFINVATLTDTLGDVCHYSHDLLVAILGHGNSAGRYAVDFYTNTDGFVYPTDMSSLICMLRDILDRLHEQLYFLYDQCTYTSDLSGWSDCYYGKDVGGSSWACNKKQCANQMCDQRANQNCDQHPNCGVKSPLQSFLEDGLQGYIPHTVTVNRGKLECAVKNHSSIPCKTPMGFTEIGAMASHTKTGEYLKYALATVCGNKSSAITKLCGQLNCLLPSAPKSLGHMFAFYYAFLTEWDGNKNMSLRKHRENAFDIAVRDANFKQYDTVLDLSDMFKTREHFKGIPSKNSKPTLYHEIGDLNSLCSPEEACYISSKSCGAYAACLSADTCGWFAAKHAGLYLSWMVYLTETFYKYLCSWKEDCNANCGTTRSKCRINGCAKDICKVPKSVNNEHYEHIDQCNSIVHCRSTHPALYSRGFTFGDREHLNGTTGEYNIPMRTCKTMVEQLEKICSGKSLLSQLVYVTIPNFLFTIRQPFIWLNVALWLLSLLYLLHIMVIRLDLLHIKSHLHSPSSHRIAAQSLLAAARVNKLNRVFYLQP